jgi:hypothetical protein
MVRCETAVICCTIATPRTRSRSGRSLHLGWSNHLCCRHAAKPECLCGALGQVGEGRSACKVTLFGERSLRRALSEYVEHYHAERNHQGKGNVLLFPRSANSRPDGHVQMPRAIGRPVTILPSGGSITACQQMSAQTETKSGNPMRIKDARQGLHTLEFKVVSLLLDFR